MILINTLIRMIILAIIVIFLVEVNVLVLNQINVINVWENTMMVDIVKRLVVLGNIRTYRIKNVIFVQNFVALVLIIQLINVLVVHLTISYKIIYVNYNAL